jgi:hypothetical protein
MGPGGPARLKTIWTPGEVYPGENRGRRDEVKGFSFSVIPAKAGIQ